MTEADKHFIETCKEILQNGYSSEGTGVRTRWEDGAEANYISIVGVTNKYDVGKEFPMITLRNNSGTVKRAIDEVLWIWQKKSNNIKDLNSHIWDQWADESGSIGKAYGYQMGKKYKFKTKDGIKEMDQVMITSFKDTFETIRNHFKETFRELFKGGNADLKLTDPNN